MVSLRNTGDIFSELQPYMVRIAEMQKDTVPELQSLINIAVGELEKLPADQTIAKRVPFRAIRLIDHSWLSKTADQETHMPGTGWSLPGLDTTVLIARPLNGVLLPTNEETVKEIVSFDALIGDPRNYGTNFEAVNEAVCQLIILLHRDR